MTSQPPETEFRQALEDLQNYLSDQLPPLMVSESISNLLSCPVQPVAIQIQLWTASQYRRHGSSAPVSTYLFHALKKLQMMGELKLVEKESLTRYLDELSTVVVEQLCPAEEREILRENVQVLQHSITAPIAPVEFLHQPLVGAAPVPTAAAASGVSSAFSSRPADGLSEEAARGLRRFSLLLERLIAVPVPAPGAGARATELQGELVPQLFTAAALSSRTSDDLAQYFGRLRQAGMDEQTSQIFRLLARNLPGWGVVGSSEGAAAPSTSFAEGPIEAMHRLIALTDDPEEGARRFTEMMQAAIEQFNEGSLAPAAAMFDLARRIIQEKRLGEAVVKSVLLRAHETLDAGRLAGFAEKTEKHLLLVKILSFFPALTPRGLLDDLENEPKRERRRLLLALLEVHGPAARAASYDDLKAALDGRRPNMSPFHLRNLVYLLRRIPRPAGEPWEEELQQVIRLSERDAPAIVRKEAIATLGLMKHERTEQALVARLHELEESLLSGATVAAEKDDLLLLLDRTVHALTRIGTRGAFRAVVEHGLKNQPPLGDTRARLADFSDQDLSADKDLVARLVRALSDELPVKVLGFLVQKGNENALHLVKALSSTPAPAVRHALEELVARFPDEEFARAASKVLTGFGASARPTEPAATTLSGDLELFGLPTLLQSLADSRVTGVLTLSDSGGDVVSTIALEGGKLRGCQAGTLRGETAVYQLFEKPVSGTFTLTSREGGPAECDQGPPPKEFFPIVLEAVRRHDEFRRASVLVPDGTSLRPTATPPTPTDEETDERFVRVVWNRASSGASPEQCEASIVADSYRIRALLAHWVEEGALVPK